MRAQAASAAWNAGRVFVPDGAPWADAFVGELLDFSGINDAHDDQLDAFVAAFDHAARTSPLVVVPPGGFAPMRSWDRTQTGATVGLAPPSTAPVLAPRRRYQ